jgi:hypothetical protein
VKRRLLPYYWTGHRIPRSWQEWVALFAVLAVVLAVNMPFFDLVDSKNTTLELISFVWFIVSILAGLAVMSHYFPPPDTKSAKDREGDPPAKS